MLSLKRKCAAGLAVCLLVLVCATEAGAEGPLPIDVSGINRALQPIPFSRVRNTLDTTQLNAAMGNVGDGQLKVSFENIAATLDGVAIDGRTVYGQIHAGPFPFAAKEAGHPYARFRKTFDIKDGKCAVDVGYFYGAGHNSEGWNDAGQMLLRFDLKLALPGADRDLGIYDRLLRVRKTPQGIVRLPCLIEGPFINLVQSEDPAQVTIQFLTDLPTPATIRCEGLPDLHVDEEVTRHALRLAGLAPEREYRYSVSLGQDKVFDGVFRTAPAKGKGAFRFAFLGDTREGEGIGLEKYMGFNCEILDRFMALASQMDVRFLLMGGDLVNGYSSVRADLETQFHGWKQAVSAFWSGRPIYTIMGNHETLLNVYKTQSGEFMSFDKWPYSTDSSEAVFGGAFVQFENGPVPASSVHPPYRGSVYSFQYGPVRTIAVNNTYWMSYKGEPSTSAYCADQFGGCPEGYVLDDQLAWIKDELAAAENDSTVKYTLVCAHEPSCARHEAVATVQTRVRNAILFAAFDAGGARVVLNESDAPVFGG